MDREVHGWADAKKEGAVCGRSSCPFLPFPWVWTVSTRWAVLKSDVLFGLSGVTVLPDAIRAPNPTRHAAQSKERERSAEKDEDGPHA